MEHRTTALVLAVISTTVFAADGGASTTAAPTRSPVGAFGRLPLVFEPNKGQTDARVKFLSRGPGQSLFLTPTEAVMALGAQRGTVLRMKLLGADVHAQMRGLERLRGQANYFIGNDPRQWRTHISTYGKVRSSRIYPGIDAVYYGNGSELEYDFVVAPGADPGRIRLAIEGARRVSLDGRGDVVLQLGVRDVRLRRPRLYQEVGGGRQTVAGAYVLDGRELRFRIAAYDRRLPLVIDPVLAYSTYLGGTGQDGGNAVAVDTAGNVYVTGVTDSPGFPVKSGAFQSTFTGNPGVAFVTKLDPTKSGAASRIYSTYLGGTQSDGGFGIAVDSLGHAYVAGLTNSPDFPVLAVAGPLQSAAFQATNHGLGDAFVTELNTGGAGILYSTFLGGTLTDRATGIALDGSRNAYVTGYTDSTDFPVTSGVSQAAFGGNQDAFVAKLAPSKSGTASLVYSTYLGGAGSDVGWAVTADSAGNAYVTGHTLSTNFPVQPNPGAFQATSPSAGTYPDAFVTKLNGAGTNVVYSTYLGGSYDDYGRGIAVDAAGDAYVTGDTSSMQYLNGTSFPANPNDFKSFPVTGGAFQSTGVAGYSHAFLTKLRPNGAGPLLYGTFLGGNNTDYGDGVSLDPVGNAYVVGYTNSNNFPLSADAIQSKLNGNGAASTYFDAFVTKVDATKAGAASLVYSTLLGGSSNESPYVSSGAGIAVDAAGDAYIAGASYSTDFPVTAGAFQSTNGGDTDAFVAKISPPGGGASTPGNTIGPGGGQKQPTQGIVVSPPDFPYKVTFERRCIESVAGVCLQTEVVRACVGGNCFDVPRRDTGPVCVKCDLGIGFGVGAALAAAGAVVFVRRRRPDGSS